MLPKGFLKEYAQVFTFILRILDVFAIVLTGYVAYWIKFHSLQLKGPYKAAIIIAALTSLFVFSFFKIYQSARVMPYFQFIQKLLQALTALLLFLAGIAFITKTGELYSRGWFVLWGLSATIMFIVFRTAMFGLLHVMRSRGWNVRRIIIIGANEIGFKLASAIKQAVWTGFNVTAILADKNDSIPKDHLSLEEFPLLSLPTDISHYLATQQSSIDEIWLALPLNQESRLKEILHKLRHETMTIRLAVDLFGIHLTNHSFAQIGDYPIFNIRSTPMVGINRLIKAIEDRVLAALILFCISPLLLCIALAIKCTSPGQIFYRQKRVSWNGKEFNMLKFRTMPENIEATSGPVWAKKGENRATRIGALLRKTSLDELPQFINVIKGEMSIVGPRPERLIFVEQFKDQIPGYMQKHLVKAGITGWAQIHGWRGNTSLEKRIEYDLAYIQQWSLWLDIKIILLTVRQGFMNKNAY